MKLQIVSSCKLGTSYQYICPHKSSKCDDQTMKFSEQAWNSLYLSCTKTLKIIFKFSHFSMQYLSKLVNVFSILDFFWVFLPPSPNFQKKGPIDLKFLPHCTLAHRDNIYNKNPQVIFQERANIWTLVFQVILDMFKVKFTPWRWRHNKNLVQFSWIKNLMQIPNMYLLFALCQNRKTDWHFPKWWKTHFQPLSMTFSRDPGKAKCQIPEILSSKHSLIYCFFIHPQFVVLESET